MIDTVTDWEAPAQQRKEDMTLPPAARTVRDTGLDPQLLSSLLLKAAYGTGKTPLAVLAGKLRLSIGVIRELLAPMLAEQLAEVAWCGDSDIDVHYQLTVAGKQAASACLARSRYAGPAPVTLASYRASVERQSVRQPQAPRISPAELAAALVDDGLSPALRELIGAALHANRTILLHGPSGSGKTRLARKLGGLQRGVVAVPHAVLIGQEIVQVYDPLLHLPPTTLQVRQQDERRLPDMRWQLCQRPTVQVGAELNPVMLDLRHDSANGVYYAPPHFQANNGMLIVDDLGRQRMAAVDLINRWMGPLAAGVDQLSLDGGKMEAVPFDTTLVFVTNLALGAVADAACLRRIGYKIALAPLNEASYLNLLQRECRLRGIVWDASAADFLVRRLHGRMHPLLASYPADLLSRIADFSSYAGLLPRLSEASLTQAWASLFTEELS
ncbi:ATP-binding protein [Massilia sp. S19_KUP03_FR1]|uniref:ATP-binding protein n=1 Tax=Massilia sp. S19_KUP03_FR1 TaxID=3025503 RepID=UPI002FCD7766